MVHNDKIKGARDSGHLGEVVTSWKRAGKKKDGGWLNLLSNCMRFLLIFDTEDCLASDYIASCTSFLDPCPCLPVFRPPALSV